MKKIESQPWWPKLVAKKDDLSLRQLSEEFGASPAAISNALKRNKLSRKAAPSGPRKKAAKVVAKAAKKSNKRVVAKKRPTKVAKTPAPTKRAKPARTTKARKSAKAPTAPRTVRKRKSARPSKVVRGARTAVKPVGRRVRESSLSQYRNEMGKVVDRVIAEKAGVTVSAVTNYRRRHNIPAAAGRGRPRTRLQTTKVGPSAAKTPTGSKTTSTKMRSVAKSARHYAFRVRIDGEKLIVVAKDIADAARLAMVSGKGTVTEIRLIGPALL